MGLGRRREANRVQAGADIASTAQRREDAVMEAKRAGMFSRKVYTSNGCMRRGQSEGALKRCVTALLDLGHAHGCGPSLRYQARVETRVRGGSEMDAGRDAREGRRGRCGRARAGAVARGRPDRDSAVNGGGKA